MRALIIDDSRTMRVIVGNILRPEGFEIVEASNGVDGLKVLETNPKPDLVLIDWNMPQMCGLDVVRAVRANPDTASLRLMMVTSESDTEFVAQALEAGANEYIMKPFTKDMIRAKLAMLGFEIKDEA